MMLADLNQTDLRVVRGNEHVDVVRW